MEFNIRKLKASDYDDYLVKWWRDWEWEAPLKDFLPENGEGGLIVLDGETPVCAGFIYMTNSKVAWVDWIISNKEYKEKEKRQGALDILIESLTKTCESSGSKFIYALLKHNGLIKTYEKMGYVSGDNYTQEMIKLI
tara:strand:- start:1094 stop:1504 length:411 start_codon:yes stop_codon:yes gene_type:complete